jgi:type I restriction enzyme M protein
MVRVDLDDFVTCCTGGDRRKRKDTERFRRFAYADLISRDTVNPGIFWLKDDTLDDPDLPPVEVGAEIVQNLETALERFKRVAVALNRSRGSVVLSLSSHRSPLSLSKTRGRHAPRDRR